MVNPYTVKDLKCRANGCFSFAQAEGAHLSSVSQSHTVNYRLNSCTCLFFRAKKWVRMKTNANTKAVSLISFCHYAPLPVGYSRRDFLFVFGVRFVPTFPWADSDKKGWHPSPHSPSPKTAIYSGDLEGSLSPAGPFLFGTSTSENNTSAIYARGPVMTSSTRID